MTDITRSPRQSWWAVSAMFALNGGLFGIWAARVPAFADQYGLSHSELGGVLLFLAGGAVCAFPFAGRAVDRFGAAPVTKLLALLYPLALIVLPLMPSVWGLAVALFVFGVVHGAMDVSMNGWGAELERRVDRAWMTSFHAMFSLGAGLGAGSGYIAAQMDLSLLSHFVWTGCALTGLCLWIARHPWISDTTQGTKGPAFALPSGALVLVGFVAFCSSVGEGGMADWSAVYLRDVGGVTESVAALGYAVFSVAMVLVRFAGDRVISRVGPVNAARIGGGFAVLGSGIAVLAPTSGLIMVGFAAMGIGYAVIVPLAFSRAANDPDVPPGRALASVATLGYGGALLGPPMIGGLAGLIGLQSAFGLLVFLAAMIVVLAGMLKR